MSLHRYFRSFLLSATLAALVIITGCEAGVGVRYRVYDPDHRDYHEWNDDEGRYYSRWAAETHHDEHKDFRKLKPEEQKQYWDWRHNQHE